jgi:hypothetical protein
VHIVALKGSPMTTIGLGSVEDSICHLDGERSVDELEFTRNDVEW